MAITKNVWLRGAKQKLGGVVLYQAQGETRMRELAASVANPRTERQMAQRVRWANLVNFYRANRNWMQRAFENKPENNTDYNRFMSLNGGTSNIYLTKQEANAGACVVNSYKVTDGTLPAIEVTPNGGFWDTNIFLGELEDLTAETTIGEFSQAILSSNAGIRSGDQISFIRMSQQINANTGFPYVLVRAYELLINPISTELVSDYWPIEYFEMAVVGNDSLLRVVSQGNAGGFVLVLSRTEGGIIRVSPQEVVVVNNSALIQRYSSDLQLQTAADSYGEGTEVFLSSASANEINPYGLGQSILSVVINNQTYTPNDTGPLSQDIAGKVITIQMANQVGGSVSAVKTALEGGASSNATDISTIGALITARIYQYSTEDSLLSSVVVTIDDADYTIEFDWQNELG